MKAVILAGGRGTRLAPYTTILPKPLMPIGDKPIVDIVIRQLCHYGFTDITLAVGYLAELMMAYAGQGERFGIHISYSREEEPLGTAGPLALIPDLTERFLIMNGDVLTQMNYSDMLSDHLASGAIGTIAVYPRNIKIDLGVVEYDENRHLTRYIEKPTHHYLASMGIYIFEPQVLSYIPKNKSLDLPDLVGRLVSEGKTVNCYRYDGYWMDIGSPDDYRQAAADFQKFKGQLFPFNEPAK
jgi:NDP-mannose synthase